jgi:hypothetical protein
VQALAFVKCLASVSKITLTARTRMCKPSQKGHPRDERSQVVRALALLGAIALALAACGGSTTGGSGGGDAANGLDGRGPIT